MTASYKLAESAKDDLYRIWLYGLEQWGLSAADSYAAAFFDHFELLAQNPYQYPAVEHVREGYRRSVCGVESVYYRIEGGTVEVMAIVGNQDLDGCL